MNIFIIKFEKENYLLQNQHEKYLFGLHYRSKYIVGPNKRRSSMKSILIKCENFDKTCLNKYWPIDLVNLNIYRLKIIK